ncbi:MAG: sigma-70 family RNA polymerase sigma factor [Planctomycetota bacterium]
MEWKTTSTVLEKLRDYDEQTAWDLLGRHFRGALVQFATRLGLSPADAQDAAQESLIAFAEAFSGGAYDRDKGRLKSWLFGIAKRQSLKVRRRSGAKREHIQADMASDEADIADFAVADDALDAMWEEEWRRMIYARAVEQVKLEVVPETFEMFQQLVFQGKTADEVGKNFGVDRARVYDAKYRVTKRLSELAKEYEDA